MLSMNLPSPGRSPHPLKVSAIVPTWNEAGGIEATLEGLRQGGVDEVLVVDRGSQDGTVEEAKRHADRVLVEGEQLAFQLNAGAREARGDVLLFHYADVAFPPPGREAIVRVLESSGVERGCPRRGQ